MRLVKLFENHHRSLRNLAPASTTRSELIAAPFKARASNSSAGGGGGSEREGAEMDQFQLSPSSVLKLEKGDITKWFVDRSTDAIVNAVNERLHRGGGVDGGICQGLGCNHYSLSNWGSKNNSLPVSRIIHTVGPIYDASRQPEVLLKNAYRNSLLLAKENGIQYIAFPSISCGVYGYPFNEASRVAISTIKEMSDKFKEVHFVLFEDAVYRAWLESAQELL